MKKIEIKYIIFVGIVIVLLIVLVIVLYTKFEKFTSTDSFITVDDSYNLNINNLNNSRDFILDKTYPIGSIYITTDNKSPSDTSSPLYINTSTSTIKDWTWELFSVGRTLVGSGGDGSTGISDDSETGGSNTYPMEITGYGNTMDDNSTNFKNAQQRSGYLLTSSGVKETWASGNVLTSINSISSCTSGANVDIRQPYIITSIYKRTSITNNTNTVNSIVSINTDDSLGILNSDEFTKIIRHLTYPVNSVYITSKSSTEDPNSWGIGTWELSYKGYVMMGYNNMANTIVPDENDGIENIRKFYFNNSSITDEYEFGTYSQSIPYTGYGSTGATFTNSEKISGRILVCNSTTENQKINGKNLYLTTVGCSTNVSSPKISVIQPYTIVNIYKRKNEANISDDYSLIVDNLGNISKLKYNSDDFKKFMFGIKYPVNSIFISGSNGIDPNTIFGTWNLYAPSQVLVGASSTDHIESSGGSWYTNIPITGYGSAGAFSEGDRGKLVVTSDTEQNWRDMIEINSFNTRHYLLRVISGFDSFCPATIQPKISTLQPSSFANIWKRIA
jgi:hypothetical protein